MKVKYLVGAAGPGVIILPGDVVEVSDENAERLIEAGHAEAVEEAKPKRGSKKKANGDN